MKKQLLNRNKFIAAATTTTLVASAFVPVASAAVDFTDVSGNYKTSVDYLYDKGIIQGISATQFGTQQEIKRVDVGVMLAKALYTENEINQAPASGFTDVPARAAKYINVLKSNGIVNGKSTTSYGANDSITRGEAAIMFAKAYEIEGDVNNIEFTDVAARYEKAVAALYDHNITKGKGNKKFGTVDAITRGELAIFLYKLETLETEVIEGLKVITVDEITESGLTVTIEKATEADEEATVEVKNAKGEVIEVKPTVVDKGETKITFEFKNAVEEQELDGVWTVNGQVYSFTAIKQLAAIMEAAKTTPLNELNLVEALTNAQLKNVNADRASSYAEALTEENVQVNTLADVQKIIDATNETALSEAEKAEAVKAVQESTSQTQLLKALEKFERVHKEWIVSYDSTVKTQANFEAIQAEIDRVNTTEVNKEITNATEKLDAAAVKKAIELVNTYIIEDEEDAEVTPKADLLEKLDLHLLIINVNEANTKEKFALALAELVKMSDDIDAETVHESLLGNYQDAVKAVTNATGKNTVSKLQAIINAVNTTVENATMESLKNVKADTPEAEVLALLQNPTLKLEGIVADYVANYKAKLVAAEEITATIIQNIVNEVNESKDDAAKLVAINKAETASDMRAAIISVTVGTNQVDYINLVGQAKMEVATLVLQKKETLSEKKFDSITAALEVTDEAIALRADYIQKVNVAETVVEVNDALLNEAVFPEFQALGASERIEIAEKVLEVREEMEEKAFTTITQIKEAANL